MIDIKRKTKETQIHCRLSLDPSAGVSITSPAPFFSHMLEAFFFHAHFGAHIDAEGDVEVDPHHLVEDTGIVIGQALLQLYQSLPSFHRFGHAVIPMDDARCEVVVDVSGRSYLRYALVFPEYFAGSFFLPLCKDFFQALSSSARITLHLHSLCGDSGHHIAEAAFKACGRALSQALQRSDLPGRLSTKGSL